MLADSTDASGRRDAYVPIEAIGFVMRCWYRISRTHSGSPCCNGFPAGADRERIDIIQKRERVIGVPVDNLDSLVKTRFEEVPAL